MGTPKVVHIIGGGTRQYVDGSHLYLGSKAMGNTAKRIAELCVEHSDTMDVVLTLTVMAGGDVSLDTNENLKTFADALVADTRTKIVFWTPSVLDFHLDVARSKDEARLITTHAGQSHSYEATLTSTEKLVQRFRKGEAGRKDIFLVACK